MANKTTNSNITFPFYSFKGTHFEIGEQYGESCRDLIKLHKKYAFERLSKKINITSEKEIENASLQYRPFVKKYTPFFDEEIKGLARGSGLTLGEAYFLQLRAEIYNFFDTTDECTTFAVSKENTQKNIPLLGQNADLPSFYKEVGVVIESKYYDNTPETLMLTPAGQISYIGINSKGVAVGANFLKCDGWKIGFPRYLLSKMILTKSNIKDARETIENVERASSRNLIMIDTKNNMLNLETVPNKIAEITSGSGILAHSNHFISKKLRQEEKKQGEELKNSKERLNRILSLLKNNNKNLNIDKIKEIFRDREGFPHTLCRDTEDFAGHDAITFASMIADPVNGDIWIAVGPPNKHHYRKYSFS